MFLWSNFTLVSLPTNFQKMIRFSNIMAYDTITTRNVLPLTDDFSLNLAAKCKNP